MSKHFSISLPEKTRKFVDDQVLATGIARSRLLLGLIEMARERKHIPSALRTLRKLSASKG